MRAKVFDAGAPAGETARMLGAPGCGLAHATKRDGVSESLGSLHRGLLPPREVRTLSVGEDGAARTSVRRGITRLSWRGGRAAARTYSEAGRATPAPLWAARTYSEVGAGGGVEYCARCLRDGVPSEAGHRAAQSTLVAAAAGVRKGRRFRDPDRPWGRPGWRRPQRCPRSRRRGTPETREWVIRSRGVRGRRPVSPMTNSGDPSHMPAPRGNSGPPLLNFRVRGEGTPWQAEPLRAVGIN